MRPESALPDQEGTGETGREAAETGAAPSGDAKEEGAAQDGGAAAALPRTFAGLDSDKSPEGLEPSTVTPDLEGASDREKRPRILMQESFQLTSEKFAFDQSVTFESQRINPVHASGQNVSEQTNKQFWDASAVDFTNQIMKMSDHDQAQVEDMQHRLLKTRQSLQEKSVLFEAMEKNFALAQAMIEHSSKELKLLKRQNVKLKGTYQVQNKELKALRQAHEQVVEEVEFLRKKNEVFEEADKHVQFLNDKIHNLQMEIERQAEELRQCDFQIRNCKAENKVLKEDLLNGDTSLVQAREDLARVTEQKTRLDGQVLKLGAKGEEDAMKIEELEGQVKDLTASVLRRGVEAQDLKA